jgi:hypothetical protein
MTFIRISKIIRRTVYGFCLVLFITACSLIPGGMTPEDAVQKTFSSPDFQVAIVRKLNDGAIVLYHKPQPDQVPGDPTGMSFQLGFSYLDRRNGRWWTRSGQSGSFTPEQGSKAIFLITRVQIQGQDNGVMKEDDVTLPLFVFGKILDPRIVTIELLKDDGKTIQEIPSNSMFALLELNDSFPCKLRFRDNPGETVAEYSLAGLPEWQVQPDLSQKIDQVCRKLH